MLNLYEAVFSHKACQLHVHISGYTRNIRIFQRTAVDVSSEQILNSFNVLKLDII